MVSKYENDCSIVPTQTEAKRDGEINPKTITISIKFILKILMLSKRYEYTDVDRRIWLNVHRRLTSPPAVTLTK